MLVLFKASISEVFGLYLYFYFAEGHPELFYARVPLIHRKTVCVSRLTFANDFLALM